MARYDGDHARYQEDDFEVGPPRGRYIKPTSAGMIGFISAVVSLGLLVVVAVLYVLLKQEERAGDNRELQRWMAYWFLILDIVSFFAGLTAVVLGARGTAPSNPLYRGWAITALVLGILELLGTLVLGFIMTCNVFLLEILR
jgi:hypothetical protein